MGPFDPLYLPPLDLDVHRAEATDRVRRERRRRQERTPTKKRGGTDGEEDFVDSYVPSGQENAPEC